MAKIAVELEQALAQRAVTGGPGSTTARLLAQGKGWTVSDVVCTCGPQDRPFEEQHSGVSLAIVVAGSFQYRGATRHGATARELMTPGSLLLGSPGQCFECGHEHRAGDRCLSFWYAPDYFEDLAAGAGVSGVNTDFGVLRLPSLRALSALVAQACSGLIEHVDLPWEELGVRLAAQTIQILNGGLQPDAKEATPSSLARVTRTLRRIERDLAGELTLGNLAQEAGLNPYHFLRLFERLAGVTPHQYVLRARLREAAMQLAAERGKIVDIAFDCGFGDVSNFNRAFRAEFGASPRAFRRESHVGARPRAYSAPGLRQSTSSII